MPDGDSITKDFQWQLHDTLYGCGANGFHLEYGKTIDGLCVPDAKSQDVDFAAHDGIYANPDFVSVRQIVIPAIIKSPTESQAMSNLKAFTLIWVPKTTDTDLAIRLPGWGLFEVHGRPRGAKVDLTLERQGVVRVLLRFDCPDPTITYI